VEVVQLVTGQKTRIPLAGPANKQGRAAGANAAGGSLKFSGALGTAIVEVLGITAAKTGLSEAEAARAGFKTVVTFTHSADHAGYYPGAGLMHMKLIAEEGTGRLLGAQIVGDRGVDKRIDVLATALSARMSVTDLERLDLAYAPQFSSAKDPVIMAGFVASNVTREEESVVTCDHLVKRMKAGEPLQVVDVRTPPEHMAGHLEGALPIPLDDLRDRLGELDPRKETFVYCRVGLRAHIASRILRQNGFARVSNVTGGYLSCLSEPPRPAAEGGTISPDEFARLLAGGKTEAIDVREADEFRYEHIPGTRNMPLSSLGDQAAGLPKDRDIVLLCQTGMRTRAASGLLLAEGFRRVLCLDGGLSAWKSSRRPVERGKGPLPVIRQVHLIAGSLILVGAIVPGWCLLAGLVGAGLFTAGATGWCGMAKLLELFPWNREATPAAPPPPGGCCGK
jgi:rhodanese-related sulfurtransferase